MNPIKEMQRRFKIMPLTFMVLGIGAALITKDEVAFVIGLSLATGWILSWYYSYQIIKEMEAKANARRN